MIPSTLLATCRFFALLDFVAFFVLEDFFEEELFFRVPDSLELLFPLLEPLSFADTLSVPRETIAARGRANLIILISSNNRIGRTARL